MTHIMNGGFQLGLMQAIGDDHLTEDDKALKAHLESLPKGVWVPVGPDGYAISAEEAEQKENEYLSRFSIVETEK